VLQFKLLNFRDFSIKLKKENPQSFEELYKFSMQQKNMDRVISFVQENFTLMPQLEDRIVLCFVLGLFPGFFVGTISQAFWGDSFPGFSFLGKLSQENTWDNFPRKSSFWEIFPGFENLSPGGNSQEKRFPGTISPEKRNAGTISQHLRNLGQFPNPKTWDNVPIILKNKWVLQEWKTMAENWLEKRYNTAVAYLSSISRTSIENNFMGETGRNDIKGLHHFLTRLKGLEGEEQNMEA
jgi:hypothetical protein